MFKVVDWLLPPAAGRAGFLLCSYFLLRRVSIMKRLFPVFLASVLACAGAFAQSDLTPLANIKLNRSETITLKQLKARVNTYQLQTQSPSFTVEQKKEVLDAMIDEKLVVQAAQKAGLNITDSQVNQYFLQSIAQQVGRQVTEAEFSAIVRQQTGKTLDEFMQMQVGMNLADYKAFLKNQLVAQQYVVSQHQSELQNVSPTDDEIRAFYEMNKSSFVQSDILKLFLVIVPRGDDAAAARRQADELYNEIKNGKTTPDELKTQVARPDAGFQAGDLFVSKTAQSAQQMGISYTALLDLFTKDTGFISDMNETATDYQFYVIRSKYDAKMLSLDDVVQPDTTITVYEYIRNLLTQQKQSAFILEAVQQETEKLRTPANFTMLKTGAELDTLLADW